MTHEDMMPGGMTLEDGVPTRVHVEPVAPETTASETTVKVTPRRSIGKVEIKFTNPDFIAYLTPRSATQIAALCHKYAAQVRAFDKRNKR